MKTRYILLILVLFLITGCENEEENIKNEYIAMKNQVLDDHNYKEEELPVDIITSIERVNEEDILYEVTITNPKENMHNIKAMVVHNYYNEDVFPSTGVFYEPDDLLVGDEDKTELVLKDTIQTTKNISKLDLEVKVWIEYTNDSGEKKDIYYKTT